MTPKASFVIPAYNVQAWIAETIQSCLDQSMGKIEAVVVNDASTDHTKEIVTELAKKDKRVVFVNLERNVGRSEARNIGNRKARGEIILVLDGDDKATRQRVKDTLACFEMSKPDLVYGGFVAMDSLGNMSRRFTPQPFNRDASLKNMTHGICHSTLAYRRGVTLNVQYASDAYSKLGIDDWKFIWDCHLKGYKFAYVKTPLCYYRVVDGSVTQTRNPKEVQETKEKYLAEVLK